LGLFDLIAARQVAYKRIDLAIKVCCALKRKLKIVGEGKEHRRLAKLARHLDPQGQYIEFLGRVGDNALISLYRSCQVFLMPGLEDFGITALEAASAGQFVFLHQDSGAAELLPHQIASFHLSGESVAALKEAYNWFQQNQTKINHTQIAKIGLQYDVSSFKKEFLWTINNLNASST
jgi:glycosyltransferase involved in cell wall biosynthesis